MRSTVPLSIRIIFWITEVIYFLSVLLALGALVVLIWSRFAEIPDSFNLVIQSPFVYELEETGSMVMNGVEYPLTLTKINGRIGFPNTPPQIVQWTLISVWIVCTLLFMTVRSIRLFIREIRKGHYFDSKNVGRLKHVALWVLSIWLFTRIYMYSLSEFLPDSLQLPGLQRIAMYDPGSNEIFIVLFLWVLSHIFQKGMELQQDNELTV